MAALWVREVRWAVAAVKMDAYAMERVFGNGPFRDSIHCLLCLASAGGEAFGVAVPDRMGAGGAAPPLLGDPLGDPSPVLATVIARWLNVFSNILPRQTCDKPPGHFRTSVTSRSIAG